MANYCRLEVIFEKSWGNDWGEEGEVGEKHQLRQKVR